MTKIRNIVPWSGRAFVVLAVAVAASAGTLLATVAFASGGGHNGKPRGDFAILSHRHARLARTASAGGLNPPPGAVLAAVVGHTEIYAWQPSSGEICVVNIQKSAGGGATCGHSSQVEENGIVGIHQEGEGANATLRVIALMPNGVKSIAVSDRDGSTHVVDVTNNVAALEDAEITSVNYSSPNGTNHAVDVAGVLDQQAKRPASPLPNSSRTAPE